MVPKHDLSGTAIGLPPIGVVVGGLGRQSSSSPRELSGYTALGYRGKNNAEWHGTLGRWTIPDSIVDFKCWD